MRRWYGSRYFTSILIVTIATIVGGAAMPGAGHAVNIPLNEKGIYSATADDGSTIYLYRYAPYTTGTPQFRTGGTPVVIFTGIAMNMNQYLACTPPDMKSSYSGVYVPPVSDTPKWALNAEGTDYESYIKEDKMRYYSLAHYLWLQGYDAWFVNYRGTGREAVKSMGTSPGGINTLDTWATLDVPAAIAKVKSVTKKKMFIGGHSTGGLVSYAYLQGAYLDYGTATKADAKKDFYQSCYEKGIMPHVKSSASLAKKRSVDIKGFIGLDPAGVPPLPDSLDTGLFWNLVGSRLYLPFDDISDDLIQLLPDELLVGMADDMVGLINDIAGEDSPLSDFFAYMNFWLVADMDPCMEDWMLRYSVGGVALRGFGHYMDLGIHKTIREHYLDGSENYLSKLETGASEPDPGKDGYYYYSRNMSRMTVPLIVFSSNEGSLVRPDLTYAFIISKKSPTAYDKWYVVKETAHIDVAMGKKIPTKVFPQLGDWLKKVDALRRKPANISTPASRIDE